MHEENYTAVYQEAGEKYEDTKRIDLLVIFFGKVKGDIVVLNLYKTISERNHCIFIQICCINDFCRMYDDPELYNTSQYLLRHAKESSLNLCSTVYVTHAHLKQFWVNH